MGKKGMLKKLIMMVLTAAFVMSAITPAWAAAVKKEPALNATEKTIVVGKTFNFDIENKIKGSTYEWKVGNTKVATINAANGVVTGVAPGSTTVSCKISNSGKVYRLTAKLTVLKPAVKVTITNKVTSLKVKDYYKLKVSITPASSNDQITWTSSDSSIAKIDQDGSFAAKKAGTVTFTATAVSGRSDSVTITFESDGQTTEVADNKGDNTDSTDKTEDKKPVEEVKVLKTILNEDFAGSAGIFVGRGSAKVVHATAGKAAEGGKGYISVTGRTANWNGAAADVTKLIIPGATYRVSGWVRYTSGADVETIKVTQERTSADDNKWIQIATAQVKKGEWTKMTGTMEVSPTTTQCLFYFEADNLIDFYVDNVVVEQLDVKVVENTPVQVEKAKVGDVVFKSNFEDGSVVNARVNAVLTNTKAAAKSGKASVEVKRTAGWDGAGVVFNSTNNISKASLFGKTVHFSAYVLYKDGPDQVNFKINNHMEKADDSDNIVLQTPVKKGEWTLLEADCFIAENATGNLIFVETENDGALTFYLDDMEIKVVK